MTSAAYWACTAITAASAGTSLFFSVRAIGVSSGLARTNARYVTARSLPLAVAALVPFVYRSERWEITIAVVMTAVQALDAAIGVSLKDKMETFGPASTAVLNLAAVVWLAS